jgi:hypothetical protein
VTGLLGYEANLQLITPFSDKKHDHSEMQTKNGSQKNYFSPRISKYILECNLILQKIAYSSKILIIEKQKLRHNQKIVP